MVYSLIPNIKAQNLGKSLKGHWIYRNLNFEVNKGECLLIQGPNGVGKSVLLENIAGFWKSDEGQLELNQQLNKKLAFCPFHNGLDEFLKLKDCLTAWLGKETALEALSFWGLLEVSFKRVSALSSGQHKRALLARAFFIDADILLLDEPFVGLDQYYRSILLNSILKKIELGSIVVFTGHHVHLGEHLCPKVLELHF